MERYLTLASAAEPGDPEIEGSALAGARGMLALLDDDTAGALTASAGASPSSTRFPSKARRLTGHVAAAAGRAGRRQGGGGVGHARGSA